MTVVASMAYWRCGPMVRRAVDSILAQTHRDLLCVVVNDADTTDPPWPHLADITDPRLVRFDMPRNVGRYFIDAVIFEACQPDWWALADPDDWSEPRRFEVALSHAKAGVSLGPWWVHYDARRAAVQRRLDVAPVRQRVRHMGGYGAGLISGERLHDAGGFHPDMRVGWDNLLLNAVKLRGAWGTFNEPLAHKTIRAGSLTTDPATGMRSPYRRGVHRRRLALWEDMWDRHHQGLDVASVVAGDVDDRVAHEVSLQAKLLREALPT